MCVRDQKFRQKQVRRIEQSSSLPRPIQVTVDANNAAEDFVPFGRHYQKHTTTATQDPIVRGDWEAASEVPPTWLNTVGAHIPKPINE